MGVKRGSRGSLFSSPFSFFYFHLCGSHGETQGSSLATRLSTVPTMLCVCSIRGSGGQFPFPPFHHSESPLDYYY